MAVYWYFDIRESEYGWIKPENTVNVDEGGIMAGFGLDSLVIGSSDPRRKAFLKGSQSRTWTSFIEAVTADGRLLKPGIIFKDKELQKQWFIDESNKIADWYYITSDNGWTDNHIAVEWLKEVYLPQTQPADESDARLIILDGHGSHVSDECMATCFLNNVYCCYLPAHCSHGLQPLDNGVFNASKAAYRKELQKLASLTDSAPVDKVNFIKAYAKAREVGMTKKNIFSGWRVTGNWPISRRKALMHPEIQPDKKETTPGSDGHRDGQVDSDNTPKTSRHIRDLGKNKGPLPEGGFEAQVSKIASLSTRIASLEEEVGRLSRGKKRKAIPNPNKKFITLAEALAAGDTISEPNEVIEGTDVVGDVIEVGGIEEDERSNSGKEELGVSSDNGSDWPDLSARSLAPLEYRWTISRRLSGQANRNERVQAHQRIPKSQEETLIRWVLRQESLGYAPSHSQHWTTRFVKRHPKLSTKLGKRQEGARFDGFTPKAVNWYFDTRENEYGWIKPENTVNLDEGSIMASFGLDSLVIGSSDPKKKAMLKGVQSCTWTSFIEAITATGRALEPGIIFKGKELQKQWFMNEFELIADWHYITSPNGWTDNHIALELIILDGHGSHAQDEWMATCFLNNVYCCYLPAHCSHGLQPLDNGIFNVIKYKVNFIRAYAKAREAGMRKEIILSGWRFTGNWPVNRHKALTHPEIQPDKERVVERFKTPSPPQLHSDDTPKTSRQVRDLANHRSRPTRRKYSKIAKGLEALEMKVAVQNERITGLEEQMAQVRRGKKRKAVPNPNRRFMALAETLAAGEAFPGSKKAEIDVDVDEEVESVIEVSVRSEDESDDFVLVTNHCQRTRSGRETKKPRRE
ncbi:transposase [Fusarium oxysporum f. sp. phaseoli]